MGGVGGEKPVIREKGGTGPREALRVHSETTAKPPPGFALTTAADVRKPPRKQGGGKQDVFTVNCAADETKEKL